MFKIDDCLKSCTIFNDVLVKRFEENFTCQTNSKLWVTPGHIVFTDNSNKIRTCDARPYDINISPSEADTDELLVAISPVLEIFFDTESLSTRMFIVLLNGDVQIFEYRILLFEWARVGYFNVNIVSPNSNNNHITVSKVLISFHQNMIYWSEKTGASFDLHKREIPLNGVREITQSAIGVPQKLLKNCSDFEVVEIRDNICIVPHLPNSVNLYIILSARSHLWLFHIDGKLLWRGIVGDSPVDFISLCTKTLGLWSQTGFTLVCKILGNVKNYAYLLHNDMLLSFAPNGEIQNKVSVNILAENQKECYVMHNFLFSFAKDSLSLEIHNIVNGQAVQTLELTKYAPISGIWFHSSSIPCIGFFAKNTIYKLNYKSLNSLLACDLPCTVHVLTLLKQEHFHTYSMLRNLVHQKFTSCDVPPLKEIPTGIQSEALLLAVLQSCRENGFVSKDFPLLNLNEALFTDKKHSFSVTKLKETLESIVECFVKLEKCRLVQCNIDV